jgi:outer membrane protein assembly factor BamB
MTSRELSRRRLLRRAGAALGAASGLGIAGCLDSNSGPDDSSPSPAPTPTPTSGEAGSGDGSPTATETATPGPPLDGSWASFRHDAANTGATDDPGPVDRPDERWGVTLSAGDPTTAPAAGDGAFFAVTESGVVRAVEAADGSVRWTGARRVDDVAPATGTGTVVVADGTELIGLATDSGAQQWTVSLDRSVVGLTVGEGRVVVATEGGVAGVGLDDGTERWHRSVDGTVSTDPAVGDGTAAVGLASGDVVALDSGSGERRWRESVGEGVEYAPAAAGGGVYVAGDASVVALDASNGGERWTVETEYPVRGSPFATGDGVYVGALNENAGRTSTGDGTETPTPYPTDTYGYGAVLRSLAPGDGSERWRTTLTGKWYFTSGVPSIRFGVVGDRVLVGVQSTLAALDAADGDRLWTARYDGVGFAVAEGVVSTGTRGAAVDDGSTRWVYDPGQGNVGSSPAVVDNTLYVGSDDSRCYALAANSGAVEWSAQTDGLVRSSPAVDDEAVYAGSIEGTLYAFDRTDGTERWTFDTGGTVQWAPALSDGTLYLGNFDRTVFAVDAADGTERWRAQPGGRFVTGAPAVGDGAVFAGANGVLKAFETGDGTERWGHTFGERSKVQSTPAADSERVFVFVGDSLYAFDTATGEEVWAVHTGQSNVAPAVRDGVVYASAVDRQAEQAHVSAFDAAEGTELWRTPLTEGRRVVVGDGAVYGFHYEAPAVALDPEDGSELWRVGDAAASTTPAVADEYLFFGTDTGQVRAFGPER